MKNREFKVGDHITIYGNKGIVTGITYMNEYYFSFNGETLGDGKKVMTKETAEETIRKGYTAIPTGRTATYFNVSFATEESLKGTPYDGGSYGCLDEFGDYGTW